MQMTRLNGTGKSRVVVLGAGFGGLEIATRLSEEFGEQIDVVLIDQRDAFVFGFSKLDVMFGRTAPAHVRHAYRDIVKPGVRFVQATIRSIDPASKRVETDAGGVRAGSRPEVHRHTVTGRSPFRSRQTSDARGGGCSVSGVGMLDFGRRRPALADVRPTRPPRPMEARTDGLAQGCRPRRP